VIPKPFFMLIDLVLASYSFVVLAAVIMSWLIGFNVINRHNRFVDQIWRMAASLTEPVLRPIRTLMPNFGSVDISSAVLLIGLWFMRQMNVWLATKIAF